ncbi:MAG: hypothetical protein RLZZ214_675 [Verrucomicrobiota bacterium]|jgi:hypothetical protein
MMENQITSAKVRSVRRKYQIPERMISPTPITEIPNPGQ